MLQEYNRHWNPDFFYGFKKKRDVFEELAQLLERKQIITIYGMRRVGKTTLMWQLIDYLIKKGVKRKNILYFTYDKEKLGIKELLEEYQKITGVNISKEKVYIFLDEVQKLENWQEEVKFYYDLYGIKFILSGSSSLFIKKGSESLAGRIFEIYVPILSFKEFLKFKNVKIDNIEMQKEELKTLFNEYMRKGFIEILEEEEKFVKMYYESIINKVIFEDIPSLFDIENPDKLKALFYFVLENPGLYVNYENLASYLSLSVKTVEKYVQYLVKSNLILKTYNFRKNFIVSEKKMKRLYLTAPCFSFLSESPNIDKIMENVAVISCESKFFYRTSRGEEVDMIVKRENEILPIEVKNKTTFGKKDLKSMFNFMNKNKTRCGVVLTYDYEGEEEFEWFGRKNKVKFIPLWKWLLFL